MKLRRRRFRRVPRLKGHTMQKLVPNLITVGALSVGLTAIRFAFEGEWKLAVGAMLLAAVLDALDGRMARLLKSASDFGAELDSLSDVIAFGVTPAIMLYLWTLSGGEGYGWIAVLFYTVCCALRLARFNTSLGKLPPYAYNYFTGVPAPAGAGLAIFPVVVSFEFGDAIARNPAVAGTWLVVVGSLMVSRLPTFSFKRVKVPQQYVVVVLVMAGLFVAGLAIAPWRSLTALAVLYVLLIPFAGLSYLRLRREAERMHYESEEADESPIEETTEETPESANRPEPPHLRSV